MPSRERNERKFGNWEELPDGGRRYWRERSGRHWGFQRMILLVDADENTVLLLQEIYDDDGTLMERHQKYPEDTGHEVLKEREDESA